MRTTFIRLFFILCGTLFSSVASAAPTLLYQFQLNQLTCVPDYSDGRNCSISYDELKDMTIGLTPDALADGQANLRIRSYPYYGASEFVKEGFSSISLALYPGDARAVSLEISDYQSIFTDPNTQVRDLDLQVSLDVSRFLQGSLYVNDTSSEIVMSTVKDFAVNRAGSQVKQDAIFDPSSENEWTGFIRSDALSSFILPFTGEWRFVGVVPEPGTLALLLAAIVAAAWVTRYRSRRGAFPS